MTTWTRRETDVRRIDHVLPVPAVGAALCQAYAAAETHYRRRTGLPTDAVLPDDTLTVTVTDDEVVISYEVTVGDPAIKKVLRQLNTMAAE
ncbi:hypothetical protein ACFVFS_05725 [Kitasatospora sp. NPDC057692]|uniref:hypothetical protein n=1 Tax=Kitasatospora sp. NPDC057692 TaxID=3346215 RepID=UPI0036A418A5